MSRVIGRTGKVGREGGDAKVITWKDDAGARNAILDTGQHIGERRGIISAKSA